MLFYSIIIVLFPVDETIVQLKSIEGNDESQYINASFIDVS